MFPTRPPNVLYISHVMTPARSISSSVTETKLFSDRALLALDNTTPVKSTQAVLLKHHCLLLVAALAAQQVTAANVHGCAVARAPPGAQRACFTISQAEVWRLVRVNQVLFVWRLYVLAHRDQCLAIVAAHHFGRTVKTLQQPVTDLTKMRHLFPACAQCARS